MSPMQPVTLSITQLIFLVAFHLVTLTVFLTLLRSRLDNVEKWIAENKEWKKDHEALGRAREAAHNQLTMSVASLTQSLTFQVERLGQQKERVDEVFKIIERRLTP